MAKYTARTTAPSKMDRHYYSNDNIFYACGYGMPNCTAYAWGRLYELTGKRFMSLCGNAEDWFDAAASAGLKTGQTPKLGAIACYRAGKVGDSSDGAGHVAIVEEIKANGDIVTSNSAWQGTEFYLKEITKASGYMYTNNRPFLGFIYCGIEFETDTSNTSNASSASNMKVAAGTKITLSNTNCYTSETSATPYGKKSGTYYLWNNIIKNGRIRITNSKERVGVAGQVTCWINVQDIGLRANSAASNANIVAGKKIKLTRANCYTSESAKDAYDIKTGVYYLWDDVVKNGRIRITNKKERVGVKGQVTCWVNVHSLKFVW